MKCLCTERFFDQKTYYAERTYDLTDKEVERFKENGQAKRFMLPSGETLAGKNIAKKNDKNLDKDADKTEGPTKEEKLAAIEKEIKQLDDERAEYDRAATETQATLDKETDKDKKKAINKALNGALGKVKELNNKIRALKRKKELLNK